jgi:3-vinyl bacteriochlorophyllide hydratase
MTVDPWNWPSLTPGFSISQPGGSRRTAFRTENLKNPGLLSSLFEALIERIAPCPWSATAGSRAALHQASRPPLYTKEQRARRDSTRWTLVQGVLAPIQFAVFLVSLGLVLNFLFTGGGYQVAAASVVLKTLLLYAIMITGSIWEKRVFGKYLFAAAFFWEDVVSMLVIALHTAYLMMAAWGWGSAEDRMVLALAAYASYALNAAQFLMKLRAARLESSILHAPGGAR